MECEPALAQAITAHLGDTLARIPNVSIEQLSQIAPTDPEAIGTWAIKQGEELNLEHIVVGSVGYLGSKSVLSLQRFSTQTGLVNLKAYRLVDSTDALIAEVDAAWLELISERTGKLDKNTIHETMKQASSILNKTCFEHRVNDMRVKVKSGKVKIKFVVQSSGRVQSARIDYDEFNDPKFEEYIINEAKNWLFPPLKLGVTDVSYPFNFAPSPGTRAPITGP